MQYTPCSVVVVNACIATGAAKSTNCVLLAIFLVLAGFTKMRLLYSALQALLLFPLLLSSSLFPGSLATSPSDYFPSFILYYKYPHFSNLVMPIL